MASPLAELVSLLAPPLCAACGSPRGGEDVLCERCESELASARRVIDPGPPGIDRAISAAPFDGVARLIVHGLKYGRRLALAEPAAEAMLSALPRIESPDAVVPVPPGPWRWLWRGFDPAEGIPVALAPIAGRPPPSCPRPRPGG